MSCKNPLVLFYEVKICGKNGNELQKILWFWSIRKRKKMNCKKFFEFILRGELKYNIK